MNVYKILNAIKKLDDPEEKWLIEAKYLIMIADEVTKLKLNNIRLKDDVEDLQKRLNLCRAERNNAIGKLAEKAYRQFIIEED